MAFFTFTTVSGSAATNNLSFYVTSTVAGNVTLSFSSANTLVYTDVLGNSQDTGWTLSNLAQGGMPVQATNTSGGGVTGSVSMSMDVFLTQTLRAKASGDVLAIDATNATSTQIDQFIANPVGAAAGNPTANPATYGAIDNATLTIGQFNSLVNAAGTSTFLANLGADAIDATGATYAQIQKLYANSNENLIHAGAISNAEVTQVEFGNLLGKFAAGGATIDATGANVANLIADVNANASQVAEVFDVSIVAADMVQPAFGTFVAKVADFGIVAIDATGLSATQWATLLADRALIAQNSITNATVTVSNFLAMPNKFAAAGVVAGGLDLATATAADVNSVVANKTKLADGAIINATITPTQFAGLTTKIGNTEAVVNAATATESEVNAIVSNLGKFEALKLTNLTMNPSQLSVANANANFALFNAAVANGQASVIATSASVINASNITKTLAIQGSDGGDQITTGSASTTVQGALGKDSIVGGDGNDELRGGNAADTINGGAGNDNIFGGKSLVAQQLTGGTGADTFNLSDASVNTITDLGNGADVFINAAGAVTTATLAASWTAAATSTNAGTMTITATGTDDVNLALAGGSVGYTVNAGAGARSDVVGSAFADTITGGALDNSLTGGAGNDLISGLADNDTLNGGTGDDTIAGGTGTNQVTGGTGDDVFVVTGADTVTDLATGNDLLQVGVAGVATATTAANFTATASSYSYNATRSQITVGVAAGSIDMSLASGSAGWNLVGLDGSAHALTGSAFADSITGTNGADTLTGNAGDDSIVGAAGVDVITGGAGNDSLTGGADADTFNVDLGTDAVSDLGDGTDILVVSSGATANAAISGTTDAFTATAATINNGTATLTLDGTGGTVNVAAAGGSNGFAVIGGAGADNITGSGLADTINGGGGIDSLVGGAGNDLFVNTTIAAFAAGETVKGVTGTDTLQFGEAGIITYVGSTVSSIEVLDLTAGATNAVVVTQGTGLNTVLDLGVALATLTINKQGTNFGAQSASAADVVAAGQWNYTAGSIDGVLTYFDEVSSSAVAVTLVGVEAGALTGGVAVVNNNLKFTQA